AATPPPMVAAAGGRVVSGAVARGAPAVRPNDLPIPGGPGRRLVSARARRYPPSAAGVAPRRARPSDGHPAHAGEAVHHARAAVRNADPGDAGEHRAGGPDAPDPVPDGAGDGARAEAGLDGAGWRRQWPIEPGNAGAPNHRVAEGRVPAGTARHVSSPVRAQQAQGSARIRADDRRPRGTRGARERAGRWMTDPTTRNKLRFAGMFAFDA